MSDLFREPVLLADTEPVVEAVAEIAERSQADQEGDFWASQYPNDLSGIEDRLQAVENRLEALTGAVNQFGTMLDFMVKSVAEVGQQFRSQGIGGLLGMLGGGKSE